MFLQSSKLPGRFAHIFDFYLLMISLLSSIFSPSSSLVVYKGKPDHPLTSLGPWAVGMQGPTTNWIRPRVSLADSTVD